MRITRRNFLQAVVVAAPAVQACSSNADVLAPGVEQVEDGQAYFPQSLASGDPKPDSVILWTRVFDDAKRGSDLMVTLEVASDAAFVTMVARQTNLPALAAHDNALKVKLTQLSPRARYYYRFLYERDGKTFASKTGRTRTAPAANDDTPVRFAVATCQDFIGRYYNSWQRLGQLDLDLDFVIFLGDYIYETTGDPSFMTEPGARTVQFSDPASALTLGSPGAIYAAAQSVSNYRDIYRTVRSDAALRAVHENHPFVFIWDDHEYSNDCWGATATYYDGAKDETNVDRRRNAEQAFFEYVPLDHPDSVDGVIDVDQLPRYPDTKIYRDLGFGKNLRLIVADYRTYRPDHLIPEGAFPAEVAMTQDALTAAGLADKFTSDTFAYVDIDAPEYAVPKALLGVAYQQLAMSAGLDATTAAARANDAVKGPLALVFVNAVLTSPQLNATAIDPTGKPRGIAWVHMGKRDLFSSRGSRYIVIKDTYDAYAAYQYAKSAGASENAYGDAQKVWLDSVLSSPESWKVLVSSVSLTSLIFDLRDKTDIPDASLRNRYYLNADQWDGFPDMKRELLAKLAATPGGKAFAVSGDIHASFASVENNVACLTTPAISSQSVKEGARGVAVAAGFDETTAIYKYVVTQIDQSFTEANPGIAFSNSDNHGFLIVEVRGESALATFHVIPSVNVGSDFSMLPTKLGEEFVEKSFLVTPGSIVPMT